MRLWIVVQDGEGEDAKPTAEVFTTKREARHAFHKIDSGTPALFEVGRSQAIKRANFTIEHKTSKNSLADKSESQLRKEAKKRNLSIAGNPQASCAEIIAEIQQDELTRRLAHRRPLSSDNQQLNAEETDDSKKD